MIDVDQFYGFELEGFPSKIAEVAMWMMDHLMNNQLSLEFGQTFIRLPLSKSPQIFNCDALEINWNDYLGYEKCNYIFGNPPFVGHKFQSLTDPQSILSLFFFQRSNNYNYHLSMV